MRTLRAWLPFGVLLALALGVGLAAGPYRGGSERPSVENAGPRGLAVLAAWLRATGTDVRVGERALTEIPGDVRTVVIPAPVAAEVTAAEVEALERFVTGGGTLVALLPRGGGQPALKRWLKARTGGVAPLDDVPGVADPGGSTVVVKLKAGALAHASALRLSAEAMVSLDREDAVPVTEPPALWWWRRGEGEVWVAAGADLAENARLELLDNAAFWAALGARGPVWIDEWHHRPPAGAPLPVPLVAAVLQGVLVALVFVASAGSRLGPPRGEPKRVHRSKAEYVDAMAALLARAGVDAELVEALRARLRRTLHDALGIAPAVPWDDAARLAAQRTEVDAAQVRAVASATDFLEASRRVAEVERVLSGRSRGGGARARGGARR
jgi:hypothetical protein